MEDNPHHTLALGWNCATWPLGSRNIPLPAFPDQCRGLICCSEGRNTHSPNLKSLTVHRKEKNGLKFHQRRFKLDIRENLFSERVVKYWHRLFRDSVTITGGVPEPWECDTEGRGHGSMGDLGGLLQSS